MTRNRRVRTAALAAVALSVLAACGSDEDQNAAVADGPTPVRWIYDHTPTSADLPVLVGLREGWFSEAGLKVTTTPGGKVDQLRSVADGQHDLTLGGGVELLLAQAEGLPVKAVGLVQPQALEGLICRPGSSITADNPESLLDRKLATAGNDADDAVWQIWRDREGLRGRVNEVAPDAGLPLLFQGVVDCYPEFLTLAPLQAEQEFGAKPVVFPFAEQVGVIGQVLDVNTDFAEKNPQAVSGFVDVYARGMQWAVQNPAAAVALMKKTYPQIDEAVTAKELEELGYHWGAGRQQKNGYLAIDDRAWRGTVEALTRAGRLNEKPELAEVYTKEFLPEKPYLP
ncbi:ABC transporter substrate-binding protein [Kineosporia rhizophila]|uniref:ABC transporter substrate-binding protein n=1 Tax=Kineosporia rhizophila TaxID=84633 RepID=UPI001E604215|nr:ABC transporter substrate-binding protein [Kineosporia rhizophila]MCE0534191.1 ABC transporter substrate-binding protein [Kineosporia rhizophila]